MEYHYSDEKSTFERKIELSGQESVRQLARVLASEPEKPLSTHPYTAQERERIEQLLRRCRPRAKR